MLGLHHGRGDAGDARPIAGARQQATGLVAQRDCRDGKGGPERLQQLLQAGLRRSAQLQLSKRRMQHLQLPALGQALGAPGAQGGRDQAARGQAQERDDVVAAVRS